MKQRICSACDMPLDMVFKTTEVQWDYCEEDGRYYSSGTANPIEQARCGECGETLIDFPKELLTK